MTTPGTFRQRWGGIPLAVYIAGILLPATAAAFRPELLFTIGLPAFAVLFWLGPFTSAAAVFWSGWGPVWRTVWIVLIPVLATPTFIPLVM